AVSPPGGDLSLESETQRRSPEVRSTACPARPPDLPPRSLMTVDFAITCSLVRPGRPRYPVLVHRAAALLRASFRLRLATTPLRFANPSPSSGWIEDFHLQAVVHARHTKKGRPFGRPFQHDAMPAVRHSPAAAWGWSPSAFCLASRSSPVAWSTTRIERRVLPRSS